MLSKLPVMIVSMILAFVIGLTPVLGDSRIQGDNPNDLDIIVIEGPVQAINVNVITIANIEVVINVDNPVLNTLQVGNVVEVISQVSSASGPDHIIADSIVVTSSNIVSPTITLRGPIQAVNANIVTIFNLNIQFNPDDPLLTELNVGDVIEVDGNLLVLGETSIVIPVQVSIIVNISPPVIPPDPGNGVLINGFRVIYGGRVFENNQTTFTYVVSGTGTPPDLSHFDIEIVGCVPELEVVSFSPTDAVSFGLDPTTGVNGIKWDLPLLITDTRQYSLTFAGNISEGVVTIAVKGGNGFESGQLPGASCSNALVDIEKYVSTDNATWQDADAAPGPDVEPGTPVSFRFVVSNIGEINLTNLALTDSVYDLGICTVPATLPAGAFFECTIGPFAAEVGQHTNVGSIQALAGEQEVQDRDFANYFGGDRPSIDIEKYVSVDSFSWEDADQAPGLEVEPDSEVYFRFEVTNNGNVPLTAITLRDDVFDVSSCTIPPMLERDASFACVIGPFATTEVHTNTVTVTADFQNMTVMDTDAANYFVHEEQIDEPVIIIIEGPVQAININIITIFDIDIEVNVNDPILAQIHVGDVIRIEGHSTLVGNTIVIVAVNIIIIQIEVDEDDDGNTSPPPVVPPPSPGFSKDACKKGGWQNLRRADGSGFRNQGDCIQYANTGK